MSGNYSFQLESAFSKATGDRDWHARIVSPRSELFQEMDIKVMLRGANTVRFMPYAIKSGQRADGRWFSFNFKDGGEAHSTGQGKRSDCFAP